MAFDYTSAGAIIKEVYINKFMELGAQHFEQSRQKLLKDHPGDWARHMRTFDAIVLLTRVNDPGVTEEELTKIEQRVAEHLTRLGNGKWILWMSASSGPMPDVHEYQDWHHVATTIAAIRESRTQKETTHD